MPLQVLNSDGFSDEAPKPSGPIPINEWGALTSTDHLGPEAVEKFGPAIDAALSDLSSLRKRIADAETAIFSSPKYTPQGAEQTAAELRTAAHAEALKIIGSRALPVLQAEIHSRLPREPAAPDRTDQLAAAHRKEIRDHFRSMPETQRRLEFISLVRAGRQDVYWAMKELPGLVKGIDADAMDEAARSWQATNHGPALAKRAKVTATLGHLQSLGHALMRALGGGDGEMKKISETLGL